MVQVPTQVFNLSRDNFTLLSQLSTELGGDGYTISPNDAIRMLIYEAAPDLIEDVENEVDFKERKEEYNNHSKETWFMDQNGSPSGRMVYQDKSKDFLKRVHIDGSPHPWKDMDELDWSIDVVLSHIDDWHTENDIERALESEDE